ncbi:MAG: LCP family protein [Ruminiclostridium sp.]|nr:LCP family protein [Ruminiclostridium sp.]MCI9466981.1 LCP family protein [Ruminiclostridium sp.]
MILAAVIVVCYGVYKVVLPAPEIPADNIGNQQMQEGVAPRVGGGLYPRREQTYTFLLTCPDQESGNADAIMVVTYDVPNQKLGMLSVPRDTLVKEDYPKINASYHGGIENLERVVTELLGIPIDFTVEIDLNGFIQLVDAVGGIDFDVPVEMYYEDYTQDLEIYYQPGMQHLTGQQAMEICRFRKNPDGTGYPLGDVQRSETIQNVMKTVAKKVVSWSSITKVNDYLKIFQDNVKTNLSATNMAWFASQALSLDLGTGVQGGTLPGDGTVKYRDVDWCYQLYPEEALTLINDLVNPYTQTMSLTDLNIFQAKK